MSRITGAEKTESGEDSGAADSNTAESGEDSGAADSKTAEAKLTDVEPQEKENMSMPKLPASLPAVTTWWECLQCVSCFALVSIGALETSVSRKVSVYRSTF